MTRGMPNSRAVKAVEVGLAPIIGIACVDHYPRNAPTALGMGEPAGILEYEERISWHISGDPLPVKCAEPVRIEKEHGWTTTDSHVRRGGLKVVVCVCEIRDHLRVQVAACGVVALIQSSAVFHDREYKVTVATLCFRFEGKSGRIRHGVVLPIPIFNESRDTTAQRISYLPFHLGWVARCVSHIHVARLSKPRHEVRVDLGS